MNGIKFVSDPSMPHTITYWQHSDLEETLPGPSELEVMTLSCKKGIFSDIYDSTELSYIADITNSVVSHHIKRNGQDYLFQMFSLDRSACLESVTNKVRTVKILSESCKSPLLPVAICWLEPKDTSCNRMVSMLTPAISSPQPLLSHTTTMREPKILQVFVNIASVVRNSLSLGMEPCSLEPTRIFINDVDQVMLLFDHGLIPKSKSSIQYGSPEVLSGRLSIPTSKSMVWSIGAIAFQVFSRLKPFPQKSHTAVAQAVIFGTVPTIKGFTSNRVKMMVVSCMLKNPKHRPTLDQIATLTPTVSDD